MPIARFVRSLLVDVARSLSVLNPATEGASSKPSGAPDTDRQVLEQEERRKRLLLALIEDFKARWQELLNFEAENNRWSTLYVTAILAVTGWLINNDQYKNFDDLLDRGSNAYLVLLLAFVNSLYTLAMALKGYQIQQIGLYLYGEVRPRILELTGGDFNTWDKWRRIQFQGRSRRGRPELIRAVYYTSIAVLPFLVSTIILATYAWTEWGEVPRFGLQNATFYLACLMVAVTLLAALSTTQINSRWEKLLADDTVETK